MVICSKGPPLTALVALVFGLLLASTCQSQATAQEPPKSTPRSPPQPSQHPRRSPPPPPPPHRPRSNPRLPPFIPPPPTPVYNSRPPLPIKPIQGPLPPAPLLTTKSKRKTHNVGKKVGLSFAGIAVILQFAVAGFLAYKKKQLYKEEVEPVNTVWFSHASSSLTCLWRLSLEIGASQKVLSLDQVKSFNALLVASPPGLPENSNTRSSAGPSLRSSLWNIRCTCLMSISNCTLCYWSFYVVLDWAPVVPSCRGLDEVGETTVSKAVMARRTCSCN